MFLLVIIEQVMAGIQKAADASLDEKMKEGSDMTSTQNTVSEPSHPRQVLTLFLGKAVEKMDAFQLQ